MNKSLKITNTWASCVRETAILALPILGAHLIEALIPFINTAMAASLGEASLAATGLVGATFFAFMGFCWGIVASVGIITANKLGEAAAPATIGQALWSGFFTALILSLPVMLIFKNMHYVWAYFGQDPLVVLEAQHYLDGMLLAVPADLAKFAIFQFAIACNKPRIPLIANIASIPLLIVVNLFCIQQFNIYGIGLGTAITYWVIFAAMLAYVLSSQHFRQYLIHRHSLADYIKTCAAQLRLGVPIGLMFSIELLFFMVIALLMGYINLNTLAANQIAMQWMSLTIMLVYGFTEAVTILVAKANGAREYHRVMQFTSAGVMLSTVSMLIIALVYWFAPEKIVTLDLAINDSTKPVLTLAIQLLLFCGIYQILDSIRIVVSGALRGIEDAQYPMWVSAIAFWVIGLPVGYGFAFVLNFQAVGLWVGLLTAAIFSIVLQYRRLHHKVIYSANMTDVVASDGLEQQPAN